MKISAQQYAKTLYEVTKDKSQAEANAVVASFSAVLKKNNHLKLKEKIIGKFEEIFNQESGIVKAEVVSRDALSDDLRTHLRTYIRTKYQAKEVILAEKIDENIKGGIVIRVGDEVMDGSLERRLRGLKNILVS